ncbi:MAG: polyprenyl synthetase family protein [Opitutales bacterium]|nr:polyprenyl synthetase family protein [Opitutales bacterium]NRA26960.1 polyprenyl synthetase family protein [Opitutales bacterium]
MQSHPQTAFAPCTSEEKERLESALARQANQLSEKLSITPILQPLFESLHKAILSPGKRIRPALLMATFKAFQENSNETIIPDYVYEIAGAIELFHAFLLIHDDVIDNSMSRRGEPTLHKRIETIHQARPRNAEHIAVVFGDIVHGYVFELITNSSIPDERLRPVIQKVARMAQWTGTGEILELALWDRYLNDIPEDWIHSVYHLKTGVYTIESPIQVGAILAGQSKSSLSDISRLIQPIGVAFQIENDLHEVSLDLERFQDLVYDLKCGVKTLFVKRLHALLKPTDRVFLDEILSGQRCPFEHTARLHELFQCSATRVHLAEYANCLFQEGRLGIEKSELNQHLDGRLVSIIDYVLLNRKHSEHLIRQSNSLTSKP